jgi:hypothetical protein
MRLIWPQMSDSNPFFIKGYKVDRTKLERTYGKREDDPENTRFLPIWKQFPLDYEYIEAGEEPDGHIALVVVLADGYDRERLERLEMPCLSGVYEKVFTPGIWTRH